MRWRLPKLELSRRFSLFKEDVGLWVVQGLACLLVAWVVSQVLWWLLTPGSAAAHDKPLHSLMDQSNRVVARHFFGEAIVPVGSPDTVNQMNSAAQDLRWRLLGTYVGSHSRAILVAEGHFEVVVVKVGDRISSGHEIVEVRPDGIVLSKDEQKSELLLKPEAADKYNQRPPENRFETAEPSSPIKDSR
jgi:hypothetical protein